MKKSTNYVLKGLVNMNVLVAMKGKDYFDSFVEASTKTKTDWINGKITNTTYFDKEAFYDLILNECLKYVRYYDINMDDVYRSHGNIYGKVTQETKK